MFERFRAQYAPLRDEVEPRRVWHIERLQAVEGYLDFASEFAGATFGGGLYRVHDGTSGAQALTLIVEAFPEYANRVCPFGYDWLGRQFAIDNGRIVSEQPQVLMFEPGTGEALEIPLSFAAFHDDELTDYADAALAAGFYESWSTTNRKFIPLDRERCVGYRVPLFLNGQDVIENLEVSDLAVYWTICGQLRRGALNLQPGTSINEVANE